MVKQILCFGSDIWGYKYYNVIEQVHIQFCKRLCNLSQNTPDSLALGECGRYPLAINYISQCIKYWTKLLVMSNYRYPKHCYTMLKQLDDSGRINGQPISRRFYLSMVLATFGLPKKLVTSIFFKNHLNRE